MRTKGEGKVPADVLFCAEAPGRDEEATGRTLVGKTGKEFDRMLEFIGLNREDVYVTNVCKERPPVVNGKQTPPSAEDIARDENELVEEILRVRPKWIGAMGRVASRWMCGIDLDMESSWGLTYPLGERVVRQIEESVGSVGWVYNIRVVPLYHPAAGFHNAELSKYVWRSFQTFGDYVNGKLLPVTATDPFPNPDYRRGVLQAGRGETGPAGGLGLPSVHMQNDILACDTEGISGRLWGGSVSSGAGSATVYRLQDTQNFADVLQTARRVIFHHLLHDYEILSEMGIELDLSKCEDTMLMSYCISTTPQGLKQLARRFCGMEMQAYTDVVAPADRRLADAWIRTALDAAVCPLCEGSGKLPERRKDGKGYKKSLVRCHWEGCIDGGIWPKREPTLKYDWDKGEWKLTSGWSVARYLNKLRTDMAAGKYEETDEETGEQLSVRDRINNWPDDVIEIIQQRVGVLSQPTLDDIPSEDADYYAARDADATIRIYPILDQQIEALELRPAYELDLSVVPVAAEMQRNGMYINRKYFADLSEELRRDKDIILARLQDAVGRPINPSSGDQVSGLLFGERHLSYSEEDRRALGVHYDLEPEKWTKSRTRASVDDKTLEGLKLKHAHNKELVKLLDLITDYRVCDKMEGTYARKLPLLADADDYIHTIIKLTRTATYRWASADPNLQNIPTKKKREDGPDYGKRIRAGFVAPPGYVLGSWDFDQIEMRVLAWYSQDDNLLRVFREGLDIHAMTAALIWRVPLEQFNAELKGSDPVLAKLRKEQRASGKNIGFGVVYGVTAKGLRAQMELRGQNWTEEQCQELIDMYLYQAYPGIGRFMMDAHAEARRNGYVRSLIGHIRYVPGVHSSISSVREEALRQAANFKIQCTAAELLKMSMRVLWTDYKPVLDEVGAKLMMAVHDELLLQVPDNKEAREITDAVVTLSMTNPHWLEGVQLGTTGKYDYDWGKLK